ncbi:MAG TPA: hypothetical protein VGT05_04165 [Patescibacteria group bacterium]|nr:hypothetical protein [Patescibacteria group bacterium]
MKRNTILSMLFFILLGIAMQQPAFAFVGVNAATRPTLMQERIDARLTMHPTLVPTINHIRLTQIQAHAAAMIDERITSLSTLLSSINNDARLSSDEKTSFTNDIQTTIVNLQVLKTKIQNDTDAPTALSDGQSIVTSFHVYAIFEPKERLLIIVDNLLGFVNRMSVLLPQLQSLNGPSSTTADLNTKITDAITKLQNDQTTLHDISVTETIPAAQITLSSVNQDLTAVRQDILAMQIDLRTINASLNIKIKNVITPTITP